MNTLIKPQEFKAGDVVTLGTKFVDFEVKKADGEERAYWFTASTETRDRMGDVIVQKGWRLKDFKKNPVILWGHRYGEPPIGKAIESVVEDGKLRLKIQFVPATIYPFAGMIEQMVAERFIVAGSVGFNVWKVEELNDDDKKVRPEMAWGKRLHGDLMEFSIVSVPANAEALSDKRGLAELCAKGFGVEVAPQAEPVIKAHPLLPYEKDGKVDARLLRASVAALAGARGGVGIAEKDIAACLAHLRQVAHDNNIELPSAIATDQADLRKQFEDVWADELLDIVTAAKDATDEAEGEAEATRTREAELENGLKTLIGIVTTLTQKISNAA